MIVVWGWLAVSVWLLSVRAFSFVFLTLFMY